jgi:predicted anti-sigma-YlaC factor YlaD
MGAVLSAECERARKRASLALDGELSEIGQASLRAHVGRCAVCAEFASDLEALTTELRAAPLERPRSRYAPRRRSAVRLLQVAAAAAAVAVAGALGGLAGSLSSSDPGPSGSQGGRGVIVAFHDVRIVPRNLSRPVAL